MTGRARAEEEAPPLVFGLPIQRPGEDPMDEAQSPPGRPRPFPLGPLLLAAGVLVAAQGVIFLFLGRLPALSPWAGAAVDAALVALVAPILYLLLVRPARRELRAGDALAGRLQEFNARLQPETAAAEAAGARYRLLYEEIPILCVTTRDEAGQPLVEDCNRSFLAALGYRREEVVGRPLADFYAPESRAALLAGGGCRRAMEGADTEEELVLLRQGGGDVPALLRAVPLRDPAGRAVGTLAAFTDLSAHRRGEAALQASKARLEFLLGASPVVIYSGRVEGDFATTYMSENVTRLFGYPPEAFTADPFFWTEHIHPDDAPAVWAALGQAAATGGLETVHRFRHQDGTWRWTRETGRVVRDDRGHPVELVGCWLDVTREVELEATLRQSQKMEAVGQLAGGVAHDFNNLLTVILGQCEVLQGLPAPDGARLAKGLGAIQHAGERAADLTRQLLTFSRRQVVRPEVVDPGRVVRQTEAMLRRLLGEAVRLIVALDPELGRVRVDPTQLVQVLMNLAVNARDAMPRGGSLAVEARNEEVPADDPTGLPAGPFVVLSVRDTGTGMDAATRARIFEPFFTTKAPDEGTGLGLATVYGIVAQAEGWIRVDSEPGQGTEFRLGLPRVEEAAAEAAPAPGPRSAPGRGETVLLVEDDEAVRALAEELLTRLGYRVLSAPGPGEALLWAERHPGAVDLLLTDVRMPMLTGVELAARLRETCPELRVLFMSGYPAGAVTPFLAKPFSAEALARQVRQALAAPRPAS